MSMNPEVKTLWLNALRSGEYKQTKEVLKTSEGFCCLGVLCDIHKKTTGNGEWKVKDGENRYHGEPRTAPTKVIKWSGIADCNPNVTFNGVSVPIAEVNDIGHSFLEIADIIEQQL